MRGSAIALIAVCLLLSTALPVFTQSNSGSTPQTTSGQRKNEVELMLEDAKKQGQTILETSLECGENSVAKTTDGVEAGKALELPPPSYPPIAVSAHATGKVRVKVIIDIDGKVIAAHAISGHPLLQSASVSAARQALFTPWKYDGTPVKVVSVICYTFDQ